MQKNGGESDSFGERLDWLVAHSEAEAQADGVEGLVRSTDWIRGDIGEHEVWIADRKPGPVRTAGVAAWADSMERRQSKGSSVLDRALAIPDAARRRETIQRKVDLWKEIDEAGARKVLRDAGLNPGEFGVAAE